MLADELVEALPLKSNYMAIDPLTVPKLIDRIRASQKFVLTEDTIQMALNTLESKPSSLISAIEYIVPPYPLTWIEYETAHKRVVKEAEDPNRPTSKRVGFLIESIAPGEYFITMGFSYKDSFLESTISPLAFAFSGKGGLMGAVDVPAYADYEQEIRKRCYGIHKNEEEAEASSKINSMFIPMPVLYLPNFWKKLQAHTTREQIMGGLHADWEGETGIVFAVLLLMNCKNSITIEKTSIDDALNKARVKRGKLPLSDYHVLKLNLSESQKRMLSRVSAEEAKQIRLHWRRGHFKKRSTGLFWWSPHLAGRKELGFAQKEYAV